MDKKILKFEEPKAESYELEYNYGTEYSSDIDHGPCQVGRCELGVKQFGVAGSQGSGEGHPSEDMDQVKGEVEKSSAA